MIWNLLEHMSNLMTSAAVSVWTEAFRGLPLVVKTLAVFFLFLTLGMCIMECWGGFRLRGPERFLLGLGLGVEISFVLFALMLGTEDMKVLIYVLCAGFVCAFINLLLPRVFLGVCGFILGSIAGGELVRAVASLQENADTKRWIILGAAIAGCLLFVLFGKKFAGVAHGLIGGAFLGAVIGSMIPLDKIPVLWDTLDLSRRIFRIIVVAVFAGTGILAQEIQLSAIRKRERLYGPDSSSNIPRADADESGQKSTAPGNTEEDPLKWSGSGAAAGLSGGAAAGHAAYGRPLSPGRGGASGHPGNAAQNVADFVEMDAIARVEEESLLEAGEDLEGKSQALAKQLTATVAKAVAAARLQDRCEDVAEGLYSSDIAAGKLGISIQLFLEAMQLKGFHLPDRGTEQKKNDLEADGPEAENEAEKNSEQDREKSPETDPGKDRGSSSGIKLEKELKKASESSPEQSQEESSEKPAGEDTEKSPEGTSEESPEGTSEKIGGQSSGQGPEKKQAGSGRNASGKASKKNRGRKTEKSVNLSK